MAQRNELAMRARVVGLDPSTIPNDSKLEQKVLWLERYAGAVTGTAPASTLTSDNTELSDGDTVTINLRVYRFKNTPAQINDIKRDGTTADTTLGNFVKAINGTGLGDGSDYFAGTQTNAHVSAGAVTAHATLLTSRDAGVNGDIATTTTAAHLSWTGATLKAGTASVAGVIAPAGNNETSGSAGGVSGAKNVSI